MNSLRTLGGLAGGFLLKSPPKSVLTAALWVGARSHPAVTIVMLVIISTAWARGARDA